MKLIFLKPLWVAHLQRVLEDSEQICLFRFLFFAGHGRYWGLNPELPACWASPVPLNHIPSPVINKFYLETVSPSCPGWLWTWREPSASVSQGATRIIDVYLTHRIDLFVLYLGSQWCARIDRFCLFYCNQIFFFFFLSNFSFSSLS